MPNHTKLMTALAGNRTPKPLRCNASGERCASVMGITDRYGQNARNSSAANKTRRSRWQQAAMEEV